MILSTRGDGLGQRLLHLFYAKKLSECYDRKLCFFWLSVDNVKNLHCPIKWEELFESHKDVYDLYDYRFFQEIEKKIPITKERFECCDLISFNSFGQLSEGSFNAIPFVEKNPEMYHDVASQFKVKKELNNQVLDFVNNNFQGKTLGIHYRTGDIFKPNYYLDRPRLKPNEMVDHVKKSVDINKFNSIFVAHEPDELGVLFVEILKQKFTDKKIITFKKKEINQTKFNFIHGDAENIKDAFTECLMLSNCNFIKKSPFGSLGLLASIIGNKKTL